MTSLALLYIIALIAAAIFVSRKAIVGLRTGQIIFGYSRDNIVVERPKNPVTFWAVIAMHLSVFFLMAYAIFLKLQSI